MHQIPGLGLCVKILCHCKRTTVLQLQRSLCTLCKRGSHTHIAFRKFRPNKSYYEMLGIKQNSSTAEIKSAYYEQSMKLHPDKSLGKSETEADFVQVKLAYETLSNSSLRVKYDSYLASVQRSTHSFQEWMAAGMHHTVTYNHTTKQYKTPHMSNMHQGKEDEWSDFTYKDALLFLGSFSVLVLIFLNERKKPTGSNPFRSPIQRHTYTLNKEPIHFSKKQNQEAANVKNQIQQVDNVQHKEKRRKSQDTFINIETTGEVTSKDIQDLKKKLSFDPVNINNEHGYKSWTSTK
uniref:dnaJ homolog subfamily C member 18-like n=1 Tax=Ciona intestinalis TaxID=7719 RepID=UPI000521BA04|nr:dnaJ homolog subfamily C member 18-like [Ciona intestinalis]XP_026691248.1 dnaJ homolog subfamily C member 18-like [Ciona intestinalis]|eukprot:XP_026691247.1 dnaJ homolog subfamily C member 18-like [Ciona intestinalis]